MTTSESYTAVIYDSWNNFNSMNIKISHQWLREFLETDATPEQIQELLSLSGPSVEKITKKGDDFIYEIEITTNRIDMASVEGIAREAFSILKQNGKKAALKLPDFKIPFPGHIKKLEIIDPGKLLPRALAVVIDSVRVGQSPSYMKDRLEKSGVRSLNNLVDITNYVMLEVGHPTHVFDYDRLKTGKIVVRHAKKGEAIVTLDQKRYVLTGEDIIFEDGKGRIIDLPGIMGLENSVVAKDTKTIVLWIESNDPIKIRKTSMRLGIRTMAASINEKNPDPSIAYRTFLRAISLFQKIASGKIASPVYDIYPSRITVKPISLSLEFINSRLGVELSFEKVRKLLESLFFKAEKKGEVLLVTPPLYRLQDVKIPEDVVEEVARLYGYHHLPSNLPPMAFVKRSEEIEKMFMYQEKIKHHFKSIGLHEVMNFSMISEDLILANELPVEKHLAIANATSADLSYMRTHLMPSLIQNIKQNEGKKEVLHLFEIAKTYLPRKNELPEEEYKLGIVTNTGLDDLKGIIESLLAEFHINSYQLKKSSHPLLDNAQIEISKEGKWIGEFGRLKKSIQLRNGVKSTVAIAVFNLSSLIYFAKLLPVFNPINQYAVIKLDLTVSGRIDIPYSEFINIAHKEMKYLEHIEFLGKYKDKYSVRFYFNAKNRNLTEEEAKKELEKMKKHITLTT